MYHFGHLFKYDDDDIDIPNNEEYTLVYAKYSSLKQELLYNEFCVITIEQFNSEYIKCQHRFGSYHRKKTYPHMFVQNLLTLMIYSNFETFTTHFEKTYRENINKHNNFFYFARYLKLSVLKFGTTIGNGNIKSFYHGISNELSFPQIIGGHMHGLKIFCPIATTSSLAVAVNYANYKGLVVKFGAHKQTNCNAKYFALNWCSDYPDEKEYLFLYNGYGLEINDIIDVTSSCYHYHSILDALRIITDCTQYFKYEKHLLTCYFTRNILNKSQIIPPGITELCTQYHLNEKYFVRQDLSMLALAAALIRDQLSHTLSRYKPFHSLTDYGKKMTDTYCKNVKCVEIDYYERMQYSSILKLVFSEEYEWIKINVINILFPGVKEIRVKNIRLCVATMNSILFHLNNVKSNKSKLNKIIIQAKSNSNLSILNAVLKYEQKFKDINFNITKYRDWLYILKCIS